MKKYQLNNLNQPQTESNSDNHSWHLYLSPLTLQLLSIFSSSCLSTSVAFLWFPSSLEPPLLPSLVQWGSCGPSEKQTNEGPGGAAPTLSHITNSLSQNNPHTQDPTVFVPCKDCLRVAMATGGRFHSPSWLCGIRRDEAPGEWSLTGVYHIVPCCVAPQQRHQLENADFVLFYLPQLFHETFFIKQYILCVVEICANGGQFIN